jgi:anti-sigma B factor antagonist
MQLHARQLGDAVVLDVSGPLTMSDGAAMLREAIRHWLDAGLRKFVMNLAGCDYIDSAGMGELATAVIRIHNAAGQLRLLGLTRRVHELLHITKLEPVFVLHRSETDALESMK